MPSLDDLGTSQVVSETPAAADFIPFFDVTEFGSSSRVKRATVESLVSSGLTTESVVGALEDVNSEQADQVLTALTPNRILYLEDLPAAWFNGTQNDLMGAIPLTAAQAVLGTKVRIRGFAKVNFQGTSPAFGGDIVMSITFNGAANAANPTEGVLFVLNGGASCVFGLDFELELVTAGTGKYKLALGSNTPTWMGSGLRAGATFSRWGSESDSSGVIIDPTIPSDVGGDDGLVVQLQVIGGIASESICNLWVDLSYEIVTA